MYLIFISHNGSAETIFDSNNNTMNIGILLDAL